MYIYIYIYIYIKNTYIYIYNYTHAYIHTHTYIYIYIYISQEEGIDTSARPPMASTMLPGMAAPGDPKYLLNSMYALYLTHMIIICPIYIYTYLHIYI